MRVERGLPQGDDFLIGSGDKRRSVDFDQRMGVGENSLLKRVRAANGGGGVDYEERMRMMREQEGQEGRADMYEIYGLSEQRLKSLFELGRQPDKQQEFEKGKENLRDELVYGLRSAIEDDMKVALDRLQALEPYEKMVPRSIMSVGKVLEKFRDIGEELNENEGQYLNELRDAVEWASAWDNMIHGLAHVTTMFWDGAGAIGTAIKGQRLELTGKDVKNAFVESGGFDCGPEGSKERRETSRMESDAFQLVLAVAARHQRGRGTEKTGITMNLNDNQKNFIDLMFGAEMKFVLTQEEKDAQTARGVDINKTIGCRNVAGRAEPISYWNWFAPPKDSVAVRDEIQKRYGAVVAEDLWRKVSDGTITYTEAVLKAKEAMRRMDVLNKQAKMTSADKREKRRLMKGMESYRFSVWLMMGTNAATDLWGMDLKADGTAKQAGGSAWWATDGSTVNNWAMSGMGWRSKEWTRSGLASMVSASYGEKLQERAPGEMDFLPRTLWSREMQNYTNGFIALMTGKDAKKGADLQRFIQKNENGLVWKIDTQLQSKGAKSIETQFGVPPTIQTNFFRSVGWWGKFEGRDADGIISQTPKKISEMDFDSMRHLPIYWQFVTWSQTALEYSLVNSGFDGDVQKKFLENTNGLMEQIKRIDLGTRHMPEEQKLYFLGMTIPFVTAEWMAMTLGFFGKANDITAFDLSNFHALSVDFERQFGELEMYGMKVGSIWKEMFHYYSMRFEVIGLDRYNHQLVGDLPVYSKRTEELKEIMETFGVSTQPLFNMMSANDLVGKLTFETPNNKTPYRSLRHEVK